MSAIEAVGTRLPIYQGVTLPPLAGGLRGVRRQHFTSCFALSFGMSLYFLLSVDYCQFLLAIIHTNYTQTCFAEHTHKWSHDQINRYLRNETISPRQVWDNVKDDICFSDNGYLLFDDTVVDKSYSSKIEPARRQYSGNAGGVIEGIGIVTMVYVNPDSDAYWIVDYRIYDPDRDGKSKIDHLLEMLDNATFAKALPFRTVLADNWYASRQVLRYIEQFSKIYYCPLRSNRLVDDSDAQHPHQNVSQLHFSQEEQSHGKCVHLKNFPKGHRVKLFRLVLGIERTEYVVTNDLTQDSTGETQKHCSTRWKIEQFHRQIKQVMGLQRCQCRKQRAVRNHIGCAMLVWVQLNRVARQTGQTIYQLSSPCLTSICVTNCFHPLFFL